MSRILLQRMVEAIPNDRLPTNWADFDLASFSAEKKLWDYQQNALQNALKALWKYYEDFVDYQPQEDLSRNDKRKRRLWEWYRDNGLEDNLTIDLSRLNYRIAHPPQRRRQDCLATPARVHFGRLAGFIRLPPLEQCAPVHGKIVLSQHPQYLRS